MKNSLTIRRMTLTAILLALLIAGQFFLGQIGAPLSQYIVGSWVNLILAVTALAIGLPYALALAVLSPFLAFVLTIAPPFIEITPFIALGNVVFCLMLFIFGKMTVALRFRIPLLLLGVVTAALLKATIMYATIVLLIMPTLGLLPAQITIYSAVFSINQAPTALIGGGLAVLIAKPVHQALQYRQGGSV